VVARYQILVHQRPVGPRQYVVVQRVHFAEGGAHFAGPQLQPGGERGEGDVALFQIHTMLAEAEEEVGARVRVDHFLEAHLALVHFQRGGSAIGPVTASAEEIPNRADVRVEYLRGSGSGSSQGHGSLWNARPGSWRRLGRG